jgi:hypothetical protein
VKRAIAASIALALIPLAWWITRDQPAASPEYVHFRLAAGEAAVLSLPEDAQPLFVRSHGELAIERRQLPADAPDLTRWYRMSVANLPAAERLADELRASTTIDIAFVAPQPQLPTARIAPIMPTERSCPISTPSYQPYQGYLAEAPGGINAPAAWATPGGRGEGIWVADVEGGWNATHEDLPGDRIEHAGGTRRADWVPHGTAVMGELAARDNGIGMVGIVPEVDKIVTASIGRIGAAAAIDLAQSKLRSGDVLLIELHAVGPRRRFLPMEYWDDVYDVVKLATSRGVIVVAAAGNGAENLDHRIYRGKLDPDVRDSGAILVGAGAPLKRGYVDRSRLDFSNYGKRVDVQGWGRAVATLDYGDLQDCDVLDRRYTNLFAGTSSASPIVTAAAVAIQGAVEAAGKPRLAPRQMRALLRDTGSPQTNGPHGGTDQRIGPRPDLERALDVALGR